MRQVAFRSFIHPPWSHRRNVGGSGLFMQNYTISLSKLNPIYRDFIGLRYTDNCHECSNKVMCSCRMGALSAPGTFYIHYRDEKVMHLLGDVHVLVDPSTDIIKFIGIIGPDFS